MRVSIRELASAVLPRSAEPKVLALLRAYLDESYNRKRTLIAGFIGVDTEWELVGAQWSATLASRDAPYFHANELNVQRGAFQNWENWRCEALKNACAQVLADSPLGEVSAGFTGNWSNVLRECPGIERRFPTAYSFCFELVVAQMQRAAMRWYNDQKIACVFDAQDEHSRRALEVWQGRRDSGLWKNIVSVTYADDLEVIELQSADMLANEYLNYPALGAKNLPLGSRLHKNKMRFFSGAKQWEETLIPAYWRDAELKDIFEPKEMPPLTPEQHDALAAKYRRLNR